MFAYCGNNPVARQDPSGTFFMTLGVETYGFLAHTLYQYIGGGSCGGRIAASKAGSKKVIQREIDYFNNTSEQVVLESSTIAFYHGVPVFKADFRRGSGFSFVVIGLDNDYVYDDAGINVLKHEYGHRKHMDDIGLVNYLFTTAVPSLIGAELSNENIISIDYYSLPWEFVANMYGGVSHTGYTSWANEAGAAFWAYTVIVSQLTGGV